MQIIYYFVAYVLARYALNREIQLAIIITSSLSIRNPFRLVRTHRLERFYPSSNCNKIGFVNQEDPEDNRSIDRSTITSDSRKRRHLFLPQRCIHTLKRFN